MMYIIQFGYLYEDTMIAMYLSSRVIPPIHGVTLKIVNLSKFISKYIKLEIFSNSNKIFRGTQYINSPA